jgi:ATP-dependent RNA helicase RhlE
MISPRTNGEHVMSITTNPIGFEALNLSAAALETIKTLNIEVPTPIQAQAIPVALEGHDIFGIAQTGTGKTLAFALPIMERLMPGEQAVVLAPTRELAEQIDNTFRSLGMRTALLIGGANMAKQIAMLRRKPSIVVATPGRALDHIEQQTWRIGRITAIVLDEADRMLDIGFAPIIRRILGYMPAERQTMLFSATLSEDIEDIAKRFMKEPTRIEIAPQGTTAERVKQELICAPHERKHEILKNLLYDHKGSILIFTRTRHGARKIADFARDYGHYSAEIHSDRSLGQRRDALAGFKSGKYRILVATDIAARGIDVKEISLVINFDIPEHAEDYVHRIGRTGRAGAEGHAITFTMPQQWKEVRDIEKLIQQQIPDSEYTLEPVKRPDASGRPPKVRSEQRSNSRSSGPRPPRNDRFRSREAEGNREESSDRTGNGASRRDEGQRGEFQGNRYQGNRDQGDRYQRDRQNDRPQSETFSRESYRNSSSSNDRPYQGNRPYQRDRDNRQGGYNRNERDQRPYQSSNEVRRDDRPYSRNSDRPYRPGNNDQRINDNRRDDYRREDNYRRDNNERPNNEHGGNERPNYSDRRPNTDRPNNYGRSNSDRNYSNGRDSGGRDSNYSRDNRSNDYRNRDERPAQDRPQTDRPAGDRPMGDRPDRSSFRKKPKSSFPKAGKKSGGKSFGKRKPDIAPTNGGDQTPKRKFSDQFGGMPKYSPDSKPKRRY